MKVQDQLGFLPREVDFCFSLGELRPSSNHAQIEKDWKRIANPEDGYVYPPRQANYCVNRNPDTREEIPNSDREALLQKLPYSHDLFIEGETNDKLNLRRGLSGFLIQFVGFLYGYRVQFSDWWVDGRVNINNQARYRILDTSLVGPACLNPALNAWQGLDDDTQRIMTNALFMFSRSEIFEFGWERFIVEYMVLDATYRVGVNSNIIQPPRNKNGKEILPHKDRMKLIAEVCGISLPLDNKLPSFDRQQKNAKNWDEFFVDLRNDLFHEVRWDGSRMIGEPGAGDAEQAPYMLHEFTRRVILSILGIKGKYIKTEWWVKGTHSFDVEVQQKDII